ncbi:PPC domain-containing DNA-binding protein [Enterococcus pallens]|uniref:PPC domain-containing protein n=1 Tax=Enterococcus pallens ATCC BAA-351 TaxID=1158607 RepID=R2T5P8_9ENTE|nr:PPC domain-containing DNA-binding protein [Enterococcus pallens]EOH95569.1 hypothetical protein UAU_01531 [Enterococcus pallens ATCC BAA-351]EOU21294.1 hypothetical protein I588_02141 [Enterococcus pallens ATCC BAA-351]OJG78817.1 hypothetical protein RV10_GL001303 [Enterococcus pallens]
MKQFTGEIGGRVIILRLDKGELMLESIKQTIKDLDIKNATLMCGYGTFSDAKMHMVTTTGEFPAGNIFPEWKDAPLELASMTGVIADGEPHIHMVISQGKETFAGHLEDGCAVCYVGEVVIYEHKNIELVRVPTDWGPEHLDVKE